MHVPGGRTHTRAGSSFRLPGGRGVLAAALASFSAIVSLLGGCKSAPTDVNPLSQLPIVLGRGGSEPLRDRASPEVQAEAERAFATAEAAWRGGDPLTAMAVVNQALTRGVPPDMESRFRELRARARAAVVTEKIVKIRSVPLKDVVSDGDPVPVRLVVRNVSAAELRSPRREAGSSDALFVLSVVREDHDVYGNVRTLEFTLRAPIEEDLVVPPAGEREVQVTIGEDLVGLSHEGFSVFRIGGVFRPVVLRVGESEFFDALPIEPAVVRVFQRGYEQFAADPLSGLRKSISKQSPAHVIVAAELVAPTDRAEARSILRAALEQDESIGFCLRAALVRLDALDAAPLSRRTRTTDASR